MYVKVFISHVSELENDVDKWLDFMQEDGQEKVTIVNATQSQDGETVTLVIFCK